MLGPVAMAFTVVGTSFLMRAGLLHYFLSSSLFANALWFVSNSVIIVVSALFKLYIVSGIWMVVIYVGMSIILYQQAKSRIENTGRIWLILKILAMFVTIVGFVIQYALEGTCGVEGMQNCFAGCPLPDPSALNNTAIKNILVGFGVVFLATAEIFLPAHNFWDESEIDESDEKEIDEEVTVCSTEKRLTVYGSDSGSEIGDRDVNDLPTSPSAAGTMVSFDYNEEEYTPEPVFTWRCSFYI
jgi:hypothetical protein